MDLRGVKILLVEDDENLGFVTKSALEDYEAKVILGTNGEQGMELFLSQRFDICLIDVMMPKQDGYSLARDIKKVDPEAPIFFVTAKSAIDDKIEGLKIGADDYITKPYSADVLALKIQNFLNRLERTRSAGIGQNEYKIGQYTFDYDKKQLSLNGEIQKLTNKESALLRLLCIHENRVMERNMALRVIWGKEDYFLGRSMDVFIAKLRKYLGSDPSIKIINIHGVGFRLEIS
ncbi:MAG TPA: DNA-binding response regulator [Flavobacteriales bacterium]|jgi:DNA-binding response OmpR family regulator|nr:DNA-binding response regulator [Flavobacteriales bacterium]